MVAFWLTLAALGLALFLLLGQLVVARDRLLNYVSHELRSPLTRLQLAIGLAGRTRHEPSRR